MSFKATAWAIKQNYVGGLQKLVLVVLADCMNEKTGQCNPSVTTITDMAGIAKSTVKKILKELETAGLISRSLVYSNSKAGRECVGCLYGLNIESNPIKSRGSTVNLGGATVDPRGLNDDSGVGRQPPHVGRVTDPNLEENLEIEPRIDISFVKTPESAPQIANDNVEEKPAQKAERKKDWLIDPNVVVEIYRRVLPELSDIRELTQARKDAIEARAENAMKVNKVKREELEGWFETYFQRVSQSSFLMGRTGKNKWRAYFDWLFKPSNVNKVLEGNYDDSGEDDSTEEYWIGRKSVSRFKGGAMKPKKRMNGILTQADLDSFSDEDWLK